MKARSPALIMAIAILRTVVALVVLVLVVEWALRRIW